MYYKSFRNGWLSSVVEQLHDEKWSMVSIPRKYERFPILVVKLLINSEIILHKTTVLVAWLAQRLWTQRRGRGSRQGGSRRGL